MNVCSCAGSESRLSLHSSVRRQRRFPSTKLPPIAWRHEAQFRRVFASDHQVVGWQCPRQQKRLSEVYLDRGKMALGQQDVLAAYCIWVAVTAQDSAFQFH